MDNLFFNSWASVFRTSVLTLLAYIALVLILRVTGKRTLTKMNTFDFIVTIALGSSFATIVLNQNIAFVDGVILFFLLIFLQFFITWLSVRFRKFKHFITGTPALLLYKGEIYEDVMRKERIMKEELFVVARSKGVSDLKDVDAIILETNGDLTLIRELAKEEETIRDAEGRI
jgi:uncharacterized membrane protein YcaP (DUF421 family)